MKKGIPNFCEMIRVCKGNIYCETIFVKLDFLNLLIKVLVVMYHRPVSIFVNLHIFVSPVNISCSFLRVCIYIY